LSETTGQVWGKMRMISLPLVLPKCLLIYTRKHKNKTNYILQFNYSDVTDLTASITSSVVPISRTFKAKSSISAFVRPLI
jgi:hypothetical protein